MLSRVASSLYAMGVSLERTEQLARMLRVHSNLELDRAARDDDTFWVRYLELAGWSGLRVTGGEEAIRLAVDGARGPSIRRALERARSSCQAVRPSVSTEVFEQLNSLHWRLQERDWSQDLHGFLTETTLGCHLVKGLIDDTMAHDEAWDFLRLGIHLERARLTTRLVTRKCAELVTHPDDAIEWAAVLRCATAFEAYRWHFSAPVRPDRVAAFLLFESRLPRSAGFCIAQAVECVRRVQAVGARAMRFRVLGQLSALFEYGDGAEVAEQPAVFAADFERLHQELQEALGATYFRPSRLAAQLPSGPLREQPQQ